MKVAINTLPYSRGGGMTYLRNVLPRLADTEKEYYVYVPQGREAITDIQASNITYLSVRFPTGHVVLRLFYEQLILPLLLLIRGIDVLYSPTGVTSLLAPCSTVIAVRNFKAYDPQGKHSKRTKYQIQRFLTRLSANRSKSIIFISDFSRDVIRPYLGVSEHKCHVIYHGIDESVFQSPAQPDESLRQDLLDYSPYLVYVSTVIEHKNHHTLIDGYSRLPDELRNKHPLLIVGKCGDQEYWNELEQKVLDGGLSEDVVFVGYVDYEYIPFVYQQAILSVFPSRLETFGNPVVESMMAGLPVAASNATAIPEVTGGAADLFDPDDPAAVTKTLERLLTDQEHRTELAKASTQRAKRFSWDRTVKETYNVLRNAA